MFQVILSIVTIIVLLTFLSARLRRYRPAEQPWLFAALSAHIATAAIQPPLMRLLGGSDMFGYYSIGTVLLVRLFRLPVETIGVLWGLLIQNGDPLPFPAPITTNSSTGAMTALTTIALLPAVGSLYAAGILVAGLSFFAKLRIYDVFRAEFDASLQKRILGATLLVPTLVFWTSGLIKEAFGVIGLGLIFKEIHALYRGTYTLGGAFVLVFGVLLVATIKGYLLLPLGAASAAAVVLSRAEAIRGRLVWVRRLATAGLGVAVIGAAGLLSSRFDPENLVDETVHQQEIGEQAEGGSSYTLVSNRSTLGQIAAIPLALATSLFRPFIFESRKVQMIANGLEMLFFTVLFLMALRRGLLDFRYMRSNPMLIFCSVFSLVLAIGVGLASTNLGTLSRYRAPMVPFLWTLVAVVANRRVTRIASNPESRAAPENLRLALDGVRRRA